jgi:hypothetical protein
VGGPKASSRPISLTVARPAVNRGRPSALALSTTVNCSREIRQL